MAKEAVKPNPRQAVVGTLEFSVPIEDCLEISAWLEKRLDRIRKDAAKMGMIRYQMAVHSSTQGVSVSHFTNVTKK